MYKNLVNKWVVAQIRPNSYDLAVRNLKRQGFETFVPKMKSTTTKANKFISKEVPVFPGYAFIGINILDTYWAKINSTYGVSKLLSFNNKPYQIPYDLIEALKNRYKDKSNPLIDGNLKMGDAIKFNNGPFSNLIATIENVSSINRIYVILDVMGGNRKLQINVNEKINFLKV